MDETLEIISAPVSAEDRVFDEIIQEVKQKTKAWANDPNKAEQAENISALISFLNVAMRHDKNPAGAAYCAFKLAAEINQIVGPGELEDIAQRFSVMRLEIDTVVEGLKQGGHRPKAALVWAELIKRCGQQGSCCLAVEIDPNTDEQIIVWGRPSGAIDRLRFSALQRRLVRKNDTKATRR